MSIQPVSFQNTVVDNSTENPTTTSTLTNVRSVKSLFDKGQTKCAVAASNETPSKIDSCDSLFVPKKEKVTIDNNGSNSVSNDKKAKGQIIALSLSTIIGAVLAPLTGGISLLPTAFLVLYGNAAAIAMYGGSKHFIEEKKKEFEDEEQPESPPIVQGKPARRLSNESVLDDPRLTPIQPQNIIEEDEVDSPATKGDKTGQYRVEDALDNGEIVVPKEIIKRENSLKIEHQPENKTVDEVLEWVMIEGNSTHQGNDVAELRAAIEQVSMLPIGECIGSIQGFEPDNFSKELGDITELQGLGLEFNQHCLATETIHVNDDVKFIAMQNIAGIKEADELQPIS
ncbi:hypothetical protein U3C50_001531 [Providencia rettgeri]|nr:hypothetical protein [Providencia rettgeri]